MIMLTLNNVGIFVASTKRLMAEQEGKHERRRVRYTMLLSAAELELAKRVAAREFRTLPEFFRAHIYRSARGNEVLRDPTEEVPHGKEAGGLSTPEVDHADSAAH